MQLIKKINMCLQHIQAQGMQPMINEETYQRSVNALLLLAMLLVAMSPEIALADAPWQGAADAVLAIFNGGLSKTLATIAVIALGIMAAAGKLEWGTAIKVIVGLVLIFGAANIVSWITGAVA